MNKHELIKCFPLSYSLWKNEENVPVEKLSLGVPDPLFQAAKNWPKFNLAETSGQLHPSAESTKEEVQKDSILLSTTRDVKEEKEDSISTKEFMSNMIEPIEEMNPDKVSGKGTIEIVNQHSNTGENNIVGGDEKLESHSSDLLHQEKIIIHDYSNDLMDKTIQEKAENDFVIWLTGLSAPKISEEVKKQLESPIQKKRSNIKKPKSDSKLTIDSSTELGKDVISETLAGILVQQGHFDQAIEMYKKLALKYPKKGAIFAATIENLKS